MVVDPGYIIHVVELAFTFSWLDPFAKLSRKLGGFFWPTVSHAYVFGEKWEMLTKRSPPRCLEEHLHRRCRHCLTSTISEPAIYMETGGFFCPAMTFYRTVCLFLTMRLSHRTSLRKPVLHK